MNEDKRYPLVWPDNWPRTAPASRAYSRFEPKTIAKAFQLLVKEGNRIGNGFFMSSNIPRNQRDNQPTSKPIRLNDPGVAVYFKLNDRPVSLACDKWILVEDNIWAIAKHIEALRGQERWGVGSMEQAFRGYMALPGIGEAGGIKWWEVLGVPINSDPELVRKAYTTLVKKHHPDVNGERELFDRVQAAWELFSTMAPK
jgi:hypothetical protein